MPLALPFVLYPYQTEFAARIYLQRSSILAADTGTGKSILTICAAEMLLEDGLVDHVIVACEVVKLKEWLSDIETYTGRKPLAYRGGPDRRMQFIRAGLPEYVVGVYETFRGDFANQIPVGSTRSGKPKNKRGWTWTDGPLLTAVREKRVLLLRDEGAAKMGATTTSQMYESFKRFGEKVRKHGEFRVVEISATPMDKDPRGYFNLGMLIAPEMVGNVGYFNGAYVDATDDSHRPIRFKNLSPENCAPGIVPLSELMAPIMMVKRKTDPDVVDLFPESPPMEFSLVELSPAERTLYGDVVEAYSPSGKDRELWMLMRQLVAHPLSITRSEGALAQLVTAEMGGRLAKVGTSKLDALVYRLKTLQRQGAQVVCFSYFGQSALPLIANRLRDEGIKVVTNHGQMSAAAREESRLTFQAGDAEVYLSSDAGARGVNLETGEYVEQYDLPTKDSTSYQRLSRISRLSSTHSVVFANAWVVPNTIEDTVTDIFFGRKEWVEEVVGPSGDLTVDQARKAIAIERERLGLKALGPVG